MIAISYTVMYKWGHVHVVVVLHSLTRRVAIYSYLFGGLNQNGMYIYIYTATYTEHIFEASYQ